MVTTPLSRRPAAAPARHAEPAQDNVVHHGQMPKVPDSTKSSLQHKLSARARQRWPQLADIDVTHRAAFAYVTGTLANGEQLRLCRLHYGGSVSIWGFSIYRASHNDYQPSVLHTGNAVGSPEDALDTACGLYLNDPSAWTPTQPPKD